jgi:hypothetical protein
MDLLYVEGQIARANDIFMRVVPPPDLGREAYQLFSHFMEERELECALSMFIESAMEYELRTPLPLSLWQILADASRELNDADSIDYCRRRCNDLGSEPL